MKRLFVICFWLSLLQVALAQTADIKHIDNMLINAERELEIENKSDLYEQALILSRQIGYQKGIESSLKSLIHFNQKKGNSIITLRYRLERLNYFEKKSASEMIYSELIEIGKIYLSEGIGHESLKYLRKANKLANTRQTINKIHLNKNLGAAYGMVGKADSTAYFLNQNIAFFKKEGKVQQHLSTLKNIADAYQKANQFERALKYNLEIEKLLVNQNTDSKTLAACYNNLGYNYNFLKDYENALINFEKAGELQGPSKSNERTLIKINTGVAAYNLGQYDKAIEELLIAQSRRRKEDIKSGVEIDHLLANIYLETDDLHNAQRYNEMAISAAKKGNFPEILGNAYYTAAEINTALYDYEIALAYFQKYLSIQDSINFAEKLKQQQVLQQKINYERAEKEINLMAINQELQTLAMSQLQLEKEKQSLELETLKLVASKSEGELALLRKTQEIKEATLANKILQTQKAEQELLLAKQSLLAQKKERELSDALQRENLQRVEIEKQEAQLQQEQQAIELLEKNKAINEMKLSKEANFRQFAYGIGLLALLILGLILTGFLYSRQTNRKLAAQNAKIESQKEEISTEKDKADDLLLNILPSSTAQELKETGRATPKRFEQVTVLFADFVGFTRISTQMGTEKLVRELNLCFERFDEIVEKFGLEKIKTIGDCYMCAGGLPNKNTSHPKDTLLAAIEMMEFIESRYQEKIQAEEPFWQMRIGLHSGPVIAGVVGKKKFAYDIWGDTVNTASRMESNSQTGKINLSGATKRLLDAEFNFQARGYVEVKNKGQVEMFFLEQEV